MNSKDKGLIAETRLASRFIELGYKVLVPLGDNVRYDLVVEKDNEFWRVQCKWARPYNGCLIYNTSSIVSKAQGKLVREQYSKDEIDYFGVFSPDTQDCYLIPVEEVAIGAGQLRLAPTKNNQSKGVVWAKDYLL